MMIDGIKLIQRERAELALQDMFIESAVENGDIIDMMMEGEVLSEEEIMLDHPKSISAEDDPVIMDLINKLPDDVDDEELVDKLINSTAENTELTDIVPAAEPVDIEI